MLETGIGLLLLLHLISGRVDLSKELPEADALKGASSCQPNVVLKQIFAIDKSLLFNHLELLGRDGFHSAHLRYDTLVVGSAFLLFLLTE